MDTFSFEDLPGLVADKAKAFAFPHFFARHAAKVATSYDVIDSSSGDAWLAYRDDQVPAGVLRATHSHGLEHLSAAVEQEEMARAGRGISLRKRLWRYGARLTEVRLSFQRADLSLALNAREAAYLQDSFGIAAERVRLARLAAEGSMLKPASAVADPAGNVEVAQIGAYTARKGIAHTVAAMTTLMLRYPTLRLRFLGTGEDAATVRADFPEALQDRLVVVPRFQNAQLPDLLATCQIQLMPSLFEGYGIVKLEAMACGLVPVVSSDAGASTDIRAGYNGLVVPVADDVALMAAIERLIVDPALRERLRVGALNTAAGASWAKVAAERLEHYAEALRRKAQRPG